MVIKMFLYKFLLEFEDCILFFVFVFVIKSAISDLLRYNIRIYECKECGKTSKRHYEHFFPCRRAYKIHLDPFFHME